MYGSGRIYKPTKEEKWWCTHQMFLPARSLYKMGSYEILCRYVPNFEQKNTLTQAYGGAAGGHDAGKETM